MAKEEKEGAQFVRYFGPLLDALRELGGSATPSEATDKIAEMLNIPEQQQNELMDSGTPRFKNQIAWARFYLKRQGLLDSSKRGIWSLTERGKSTRLSHSQARQIFLKQVKIDAEARKKKETVAEQRGIESLEEVTISTTTDYRDHA